MQWLSLHLGRQRSRSESGLLYLLQVKTTLQQDNHVLLLQVDKPVPSVLGLGYSRAFAWKELTLHSHCHMA